MMADTEKGAFADYDDGEVYAASNEKALSAATGNFVVEFGVNEARIAFDQEEGQLREFLDTPQSPDRPVRWM